MSEPTTAAPKKSRKGFATILFLLVVLGGGGAGAYFYFLKGIPAAARERVREREPEPEPRQIATGIVPLEPFVVNLADPNAARFLRVSLSLVVQDEERAKEIEESVIEKARIRSAILELLALQVSSTLVTPEGKEQLKKLIAERTQGAAHGLEVADVLFSEFVIQF